MNDFISQNENNQIPSTEEKEKSYIIKLNNIDLQKTSYIELFKFLDNPKLNIFDIKDLYSSKDLVKITKNKELFNSKIDIFNYTLNNKFLEANDVKYLESLTNLSVSSKFSTRKSIKVIDDAPQTKHIDFLKFVKLLKTNKPLVKHCIFQFCDAYTLARIGLVNKHFHDFIYKYCDFQKNIEQLCETVFNTPKLHKNYENKLNEIYKNSFSEMLNNRPRVFFSGVYTEKLNTIIGIKDKLQIRKLKLEEKKNYFRVLYFLPNGEVYSIVMRSINNVNIYDLLKKPKTNQIEISKFKYEYDDNDDLVITIDGNYFNNSIFIYETNSQSIYVNEKQAKIYDNADKGKFIATYKVNKLIFL